MLPEIDTFYERLLYAKEHMPVKIRWNALAAEIGIDKANFTRYKSSKYLPSPITLIKIAHVLGVDAKWLAGNDVILPDNDIDLLTYIYISLNESGRAALIEFAKKQL